MHPQKMAVGILIMVRQDCTEMTIDSFYEIINLDIAIFADTLRQDFIRQ